jgi:transaldolase/glucose-6-phosphate isomerase
MSNPILDLGRQGQSVWYDSLRRSLITSGELGRLIAEDGLRGMTSNPAIFEKAIAGSDDYRGVLRRHAAAGLSSLQIYEAIAVEDIQWAADALLPVCEESGGRDGFVSLEVSPHLAHDTEGTVEEALRLAGEVGRRNLMIKVPGTVAGLPAIARLIAEGVKVNVTLLFARDRYAAAAEAYLEGLENLRARGGDLAGVASVASFFVSRIDTLIDARIDERLADESDAVRRVALAALKGRAAIANARLAYQHFREITGGGRWARLAAAGANPQRLLWASTSVKNPAYRDVLYVEELIGPDTVNTLPEATFEAFRDHGAVEATLEKDVDEASHAMAALEGLGISMQEATDELLEDGVRLFVEPFDKLLAAIETRCEALPRRA